MVARNMYNRARISLVVLTALATLFAPAVATALPPGGSFTDDDGSPHEGYIEAIAAAGITNGCNPPINDRYCPDRNLTRGEMAVLLARTLGLSSDGGRDWFSDDNGSPFEDRINQIAAAGITLGCNPPANTKFCPNGTVTRGQMAAFLERAYNLKGSTSSNPFKDDNGSIFENSIERLAQAGITKGCNPPINDRFCPNDPVRRDAMASFLARAEGMSAITPPPRVDAGDVDVHIYPGDDIDDIADSSPKGTTFLIHGTHHRQSVSPRDGQRFLGAADAVLDGDDRTEFAFTGSADDVYIGGLEIRDYDSDHQRGAIDGSGDNWTVEGNEIHHNAAVGVRLGGDGSTIRGNNIHHNAQLGISVHYADDCVVQSNEIAYNNWQKEFRWGFEAGGTKFWETRNLLVKGNWSHNNWGPGLWSDHDNINIVYDGNIVEDNAAAGIYHEISYDGVMRNNTLRRNGFDHDAWLWGGGITLASSQGVEIYGNVVEDNYNGITMTQQNRGSGAHGPYVVRNNFVHDNLIIDSGLSGAAEDIGSDAIFSANNRFENNDYVGEVRWEWDGGRVSWSKWRGYGHDDGGSYQQ